MARYGACKLFASAGVFARVSLSLRQNHVSQDQIGGYAHGEKMFLSRF